MTYLSKRAFCSIGAWEQFSGCREGKGNRQHPAELMCHFARCNDDVTLGHYDLLNESLEFMF